jgi:signal transduction histidine kinase
MKLVDKFFYSSLILLIICGTAISTLSYFKFSKTFKDKFNEFYLSVNQSIADTLVQLDQASNTQLLTVKTLIEKDEHEVDSASNDELKILSKKFSVSFLWTIRSSDGKFLTSSCDPPENLPSIYEYCHGPDYHLVAEGKTYSLTPLVLGKPIQAAYKFFVFSNKRKTKLYEIGIQASFIGNTLKKAVEAHRPVESMSLFAPNGANLGVFIRNKPTVDRIDSIILPKRSYPYFEDSPDKITYFAKVPSEVKNSCESNPLLDENNEFYYVLRTEVSKKDLMKTLEETILAVSTVMFLAVIVSIIVSRHLAQYLTKKLNIVNRKLLSIVDSVEMKDKIVIHGNDEVDQLSLNFNEMIDRLREASIRLKELDKAQAAARVMDFIGHEIRRPFTQIISFMKLIGNKPAEYVSRVSKEHLPGIDRAMADADAALEMIKDLGGNVEINQVPVCPEELIKEAILKSCRYTARDDIRLRYDFQHTNIVLVDQARCNRLFINIVHNAFEAMPTAGEIWFTTRDGDDELIEFVIGNTGTFVEKDQTSRIFEMFVSTKQGQNRGLGLAIASSVVTNHGGTIYCRSSKKQMTTEFVFTLPLAALSEVQQFELPFHTSQIVHEQKAVELQATSVVADPNEVFLEQQIIDKITGLKRPFIIGIVDDELIYVEAVRELVNHSPRLKSLIYMVEFNDGNSVVQSLETFNPDMLICDLDLGPSSIHGFDLVKLLREPNGPDGKPLYSNPICIHSNRWFHDDSKKGEAVGAQSSLPKPMTRVHLYKFILNFYFTSPTLG